MGAVAASGGYEEFKSIELGTFAIKKPGEYTLTMTPVKKDWKPINVRSVRVVLER